MAWQRLQLFRGPETEPNQAVFDGWSLAHLGIGLLAGLLGVRRSTFMVLHVTYEVSEQFFQRSDAGQRFWYVKGPESVANVVGDTVAGLGGWALGDALRSSETVAG